MRGLWRSRHFALSRPSKPPIASPVDHGSTRNGLVRRCRATRAFPHAGMMLPKADRLSLAHTVATLQERPAVALLETVAGYLDLHELCKVRGLSRIAFGSVDFAVDSGMADEGDAMTSVRVQIVLHSRAAGLSAPVDGVSVCCTDPERMRSDALRSRQLGFGGKLCIHPAQVGAVNEAFAPPRRK